MSITNKLSYSQVSRYTMCGESYRLYYIERIRPKVTTGALLFGSALDQGINILLEGKDSAEETFVKGFTEAKVLGEIQYIPTSTSVVYSNSDFDADLLTKDDEKELAALCVAPWRDRYDVLKVKKSKTGFDSFTEEEKKFYNYANWLSLLRKGLLMLRDYKAKVIPKLGKVHAIQKEIALSNGSDSVTGWIDFIADYEGKKVIFDNKTSSLVYEEDAVLTSPQLSLYTHSEGSTKYAGYIVLNKIVKKNRVKICSVCGHDGSGRQHKTCNAVVEGVRCGGEWTETLSPEINIQILVDEIPARTEEIVIENMDKANDGIKAKQFTRNFNMCDNWYGGACVYKKHCFKCSMDGLVKVERGEK